MKIAVYAVAGVTILANRWVRLTGVTNAAGAYEVDVVGARRRGHALIMPHPKGAITATIHGYAQTHGTIQQAEAGAKIAADDELRPNSDGTVSKAAAGSRYCVGVAITGGTKGKTITMILRHTGKL